MPFRPKIYSEKKCSITDCQQTHYGKSYCRLHYARWKRYGDATIVYGYYKRHNLKGTPEYRTWKGIKTRCYSKNNPAYRNYGGRGIKVCNRWLHDPEMFYLDMGKRPKGLTLERMDNNGNYEPSNCKWATRKEQMNNTRINRFITWKNQTRTLSQWATEINISPGVLHARLGRLGWSIDKALGTSKRGTQ